jgi:hypothetical protein
MSLRNGVVDKSEAYTPVKRKKNLFPLVLRVYAIIVPKLRKGKLVIVYAIKAYRGVAVWLHLFFTLVVDAVEWSPPRKNPLYPYSRRAVGPQSRCGRSDG